MLPELTLPSSLLALLAWFEPLFTAPSFRTFCALATGFLAEPPIMTAAMRALSESRVGYAPCAGTPR